MAPRPPQRPPVAARFLATALLATGAGIAGLTGFAYRRGTDKETRVFNGLFKNKRDEEVDWGDVYYRASRKKFWGQAAPVVTELQRQHGQGNMNALQLWAAANHHKGGFARAAQVGRPRHPLKPSVTLGDVLARHVVNIHTPSAGQKIDVSDPQTAGILQGKQRFLRGAPLQQANLTGIDWSSGPLHRRADLQGANLNAAILTNANLRKACVSQADAQNATLTNANMQKTDARRACFKGARMGGVQAAGARLGRANMEGVDLTGADLTGARLRNANLRGANLNGADVTGARFQGADLREVDLSTVQNLHQVGSLHGAKMTKGQVEAFITAAQAQGIAEDQIAAKLKDVKVYGANTGRRARVKVAYAQAAGTAPGTTRTAQVVSDPLMDNWLVKAVYWTGKRKPGEKGPGSCSAAELAVEP